MVLQMFNLAGQKVAERSFELQAGNSIFEVRLQKPQMYLLAVTTSHGRSTIRLINRIAGEGNGISFRGNVVEKRQTTQPFQSGDVLKIVGYASRPDLLSESSEIQQTLHASGIFTLLFDTVPEDGFLPEVFSVSANTRVRFSKGNLQYTTVGTHATAEGTAHGTWRFAPNQWDTIGAANSNVSSTYTGWIDLFAWGTSGYHDTNDQSNIYYQPYSSNRTYVDTAYNLNGYGPSLNMTDTNLTGTSANYDWGIYNAISNGGNRPGIWRTLTRDEWNYLLFIRNTSSGICYAKATVNGVPGLIILPDNWSDTVHYLDSTNNIRASYMSNCITSGQWTTYFEAHSCVFLPAAGERYVFNSMGGVGIVGRYWSSTCYGKGSAKEVYIGSGSLHPYYFARYSGTSVRLVRNEE